MKCRNCDKQIRVRNKSNHSDRLGLCKQCSDFDKKWVKQGMLFAQPPKPKKKIT